MTFATSSATTPTSALQTATPHAPESRADLSAARDAAPDAAGHYATERLKMAVRAGNHLDHREIEVAEVEVRFRDGDGQTYRVDLHHPEILRRILRSDVVEPIAPPGALAQA
ncbi:MAG: hypothetical protein ACODAQ_06780 [Phycisphaeraceae bacterium]